MTVNPGFNWKSWTVGISVYNIKDRDLTIIEISILPFKILIGLGKDQ